MSLDHQTLHRGEYKCTRLKQTKWTLWDLGEDISGNGILTIGRCKFTILLIGMVSCTCKDSSLSPEPDRVFVLLVKVIGSFTVDTGSIPGRSQLRKKCVVGQKFQIL